MDTFLGVKTFGNYTATTKPFLGSGTVHVGIRDTFQSSGYLGIKSSYEYDQLH